MGAPKIPVKRKILFIKKGFQASFIVKFCLIVLLSSLILGNILYWSGPDSTTIVFQNLRVQSIPTRQFMFPSITAGIVLSLIVTSGLVICLTLLFSHRIGGPMFRFEQVLKKLAEGDLSQKVILRDYDQCKEIGIDLNETLQSLRGKIKAIDASVQELEKNIDPNDQKSLTTLTKLKKLLQQFKY